jgi:hypothetical protein
MNYRIFIATLTACIVTCHMPYASAADSIQNAIGASKHAIQAVTMGIAASGQATLGVLAVPMLSVGAVGTAIGAASTAAGQGSAAIAGLPSGGPLPITDKTITVTSPAEALKSSPPSTPR